MRSDADIAETKPAEHIGPATVNILLIPDSFKGSLSSARLCAIMKAAAADVMPQAEVQAFPAADGGEGTLEAVRAAVGGAYVVQTVTGPCGQPVSARYLSSGDTAYVEMAQAAGMQYRLPGFSAANTTTFGVGQLIRHALDAGHRHIIVTLGGSCTNDAGCGMAAALGTRFIAPNGRPFIPTGASLSAIRAIQLNPFFFARKAVTVSALCDVTNPLFGPDGAARVFGPQKGATPEEVTVLDEGMKHLAGLFAKAKGPRLNVISGAGAAGGTGAGVVAFLNGKLLSGTDTLLDVMHFPDAAAKADLIVTGEGRVDSQTAGGKLISGVASRAGGRPVVVLTGSIAPGTDLKPLYDMGVTAVLPVSNGPQTLAQAMAGAAGDVRRTAESVFRLAAALKRE